MMIGMVIEMETMIDLMTVEATNIMDSVIGQANIIGATIITDMDSTEIIITIADIAVKPFTAPMQHHPM